MADVWSGVSAGPCSLRSRPSMRSRAGEPTLMCRSEPRSSESARRYGDTEITADSSTTIRSARPVGDLRLWTPLLHAGDDAGQRRDHPRVVLEGQTEVDPLQRL